MWKTVLTVFSLREHYFPFHARVRWKQMEFVLHKKVCWVLAEHGD